MQKISTAIASAVESSVSARNYGIWTNFLAVDRAPRAHKGEAASCDDGNSDPNHG
jgi:hypothetical protein